MDEKIIFLLNQSLYKLQLLLLKIHKHLNLISANSSARIKKLFLYLYNPYLNFGLTEIASFAGNVQGVVVQIIAEALSYFFNSKIFSISLLLTQSN